MERNSLREEGRRDLVHLSPLCAEEKLKVTEDEAGQRLDSYLARKHAGCSRSRFKKMILEGRVVVDGHQVKPRHVVRPGQVIVIDWGEEETRDEILSPRSLPLDILFEDEHLLVVNKAPNLVVHPGAGCDSVTLIHGVLAHCGSLASQGSPERPGIVHRLDRDTSGLLVIAKSDPAYLHLVRQFKNREIRKEYWALVHGTLEDTSGTIRGPIGRHPVHRTKMAVVTKGGKEALTRWVRIKEWGGLLSLLQIRIETGRTHQIRVHLAHIHHPVVGDETYGRKRRRLSEITDKTIRDLLAHHVRRQMLHARRLVFRHPLNDKELDFSAAPPRDFMELVTALDAHYSTR